MSRVYLKTCTNNKCRLYFTAEKPVREGLFKSKSLLEFTGGILFSHVPIILPCIGYFLPLCSSLGRETAFERARNWFLDYIAELS